MSDAVEFKTRTGVFSQTSALRWIGFAALAGIAIALRLVYETNTDTSWLLTVGERVLGGERLGVDVIEINPPASVYLYLPAVALAKLFGVRPEPLLNVTTLLAIAGSLVATFSILRRSAAVRPWMGAITQLSAVYALAIMPGETFAQREHMAMIAALPFLAIVILRLEGVTPSAAARFWGGLCGGLVMCIKPHFAGALALAWLCVVVRRRSIFAAVTIENVVAASLVGVYVASTIALYPSFFTELMPIVSATYLPSRDFRLLWMREYFPLWLIVLMICAHVAGRRVWIEAPGVFAAASIGFALACIAQGKFWPYHHYPAMATMFIFAMSVVGRARSDEVGSGRLVSPELVALAASAIFAARLWGMFGPALDMRPLAEAIAKAAERPTMMALSSDISIGHPVTRMVGGRWVSAQGSQWVLPYIAYRRKYHRLDAADEAALVRADQWNRDIARADLVRGAPQILLVTEEPAFDWIAWARQDAAMAQALTHYRKVSTVKLSLSDVAIAIYRRDGAPR